VLPNPKNLATTWSLRRHVGHAAPFRSQDLMRRVVLNTMLTKQGVAEGASRPPPCEALTRPATALALAYRLCHGVEH